ncbi:MAG TPA: AraC family transcriptional regulator [Thermoanaerobaculia bacterium]|nr:AraC family transcriptional regulator [Thermoanaerobaculia bacterium]
MAENFGQIVRGAGYSGIRVSERVHSQRQHLQRHAHESLQICLVLEGELVEEFDGVQLQGVPGTAIVRPALALHRDTFRSATVRTLLVEYFSVARFESLFASAQRPRLLRDELCPDDIRRELRGTDTASATALEGSLLQLAARMIRSMHEPHGRLVAMARKRIDESMPRRIDAGALAAELQVSRSHLFETFRRVEGKTIGAYIASRRLERARELLTRTAAPLGEIAAVCGFADQSHFTRVFRAESGETPAQFRRRFQAATIVQDDRRFPNDC